MALPQSRPGSRDRVSDSGLMRHQSVHLPLHQNAGIRLADFIFSAVPKIQNTGLVEKKRVGSVDVFPAGVFRRFIFRQIFFIDSARKSDGSSGTVGNRKHYPPTEAVVKTRTRLRIL